MITQKEAFQRTVEYLSGNIDKKYIDFVNSQIEVATQKGVGTASINIDNLFEKSAEQSTKSKAARQLEVLYKSLGYRVEMSYGCASLNIEWI